MSVTALERALNLGRLPGSDLAEALISLTDVPVATPAEARGVVAALRALQPPAAGACGATAPASECPATLLYLLASLLQRPASRDAAAILAEEGLPALLERYDAHLPIPGPHQHELLFVLKVAALYRAPGAFQRTLQAARAGRWPDDSLWAVVLRLWTEGPQGEERLAQLLDPLPRGFAAVALLDIVNARALATQEAVGTEGALAAHHAFDTEAGRAFLAAVLSDADPAAASYAHSAATALPFLQPPARDALLERALAHPAERAALEAAWAAARLGQAAGEARLVAACRDPRWALVARSYLLELGRGEAIPAEALEPDAQAQAELCAWLAHPHERGRPPQAVRLVDRRRLRWPPTGDTRRLWLIEFRYDVGADGAPERGVGLVGSIPCALFGETSPDMPPEDVYALHCCWELQMNHDPRAPAERTVEAGRHLLQAAAEAAPSTLRP